MTKEIIIGSDHAGYGLKEYLKLFLAKRGFRVIDAGTYSKERCDYPRFAYIVAQGVSRSKFERGILICKSGIGSSIVANKFPRVWAALCCNVKAARLSREHNDSNILVLGAAFVSRTDALRILKTWLKSEFLGGRHRRRLNQIKEIEKTVLLKRT